MKKFFYPNSITVAGASSKKDKLANFVISNLVEVGYPGEVFAIGSDHGEILGIPIFISIKDIPKPVDLLVIVVPSRFVPGLLTDAGEAGIKRVVKSRGKYPPVTKKKQQITYSTEPAPVNQNSMLDVHLLKYAVRCPNVQKTFLILVGRN